MNRAAIYFRQDAFNRYVGFSIGAHVVLFLMLMLRAIFVPVESIQIRNAIRVDVVALPEKESAPPAAPPQEAPKVEVKPETPAPPKPAPPKPAEKPKVKTKDSQQTALERLKAMDAIEKMKEQMAEEKKRKAKDNLIKGNIVQEGNSLTGLDKIEFDRYFGSIESQVRGNWNLPKWLADLELKAQAVVKIDASGNVISRAILRSSGNETFDNEVLSTLDRSSPFPPPPERVAKMLQYQGIVFNFPE